ncbi:hypothetical protein KC19_2G142400 [Ceratodon purpureus]|uniref:Uncharacterized protein n=1 Tax=Ceratodon purpureus TaxID=3225 RepID=A0A8T0IVC8_CERPU|nr:hypothetical protein KC19_2G142400 [Ceratodon purpureus]
MLSPPFRTWFGGGGHRSSPISLGCLRLDLNPVSSRWCKFSTSSAQERSAGDSVAAPAFRPSSPGSELCFISRSFRWSCSFPMCRDTSLTLLCITMATDSSSGLFSRTCAKESGEGRLHQ